MFRWTPLAFIKRLTPIIAPPHLNLVRYVGALGPRAKLRRHVTAAAREEVEYAELLGGVKATMSPLAASVRKAVPQGGDRCVSRKTSGRKSSPRSRTMTAWTPIPFIKRSEAALCKVHTRVLDDGSEAHSFRTLLKLLSAIVRNRCRVPGAGPDAPPFEIMTTANEKQRRAYELLKSMAA